MNGFDVRIHAIRRRPDRRRQFEVRSHAAGRARSKSFITRGLADSYRAELIRACHVPRGGQVAATGPHSRASLADALATITPALTRHGSRPPSRTLQRTALYQHAFNPAQPDPSDPAIARTLTWLRRASLPVTSLNDPQVLRSALDALARRQDGTRAAATTITRKRAVLHNALAHATETSLLPANPLDHTTWNNPAASTAIDPRTVPSPDQVQAILSQVARIEPELTAFFACLYYAALRPEEAVALRHHDCHLPSAGWGTLTLTAACPRTGSAWTSTRSPYQARSLKHRPEGTIRRVPIPPPLVALLQRHLNNHGTTPDGRLFRGTRGGMLSESRYGRTWHHARNAALGPELAATPLARQPYDLRHAAISLWLTATNSPADIAARAGNSPRVLHDTYTHLIPRPPPHRQPADRASPPEPVTTGHRQRYARPLPPRRPSVICP